MTSNKSALPDRTPAGMQGVRITWKKQKVGELLGGDAEDVFGGPQVSSSQRWLLWSSAMRRCVGQLLWVLGHIVSCWLSSLTPSNLHFKCLQEKWLFLVSLETGMYGGRLLWEVLHLLEFCYYFLLCLMFCEFHLWHLSCKVCEWIWWRIRLQETWCFFYSMVDLSLLRDISLMRICSKVWEPVSRTGKNLVITESDPSLHGWGKPPGCVQESQNRSWDFWFPVWSLPSSGYQLKSRQMCCS